MEKDKEKKKYGLDFDSDDLIEIFSGAVNSLKEEVASFEDIVDLNNAIDRELFIGDVTAGLGTAVDSMIRFWNRQDKDIPIEERKPIKIYVDSVGGSLMDCFSIINAIQMSKTPVYTICTGCAYSAGFFIFIAGHKRLAYPLASFLFHEGSASNGGTASQFANFAMFYKKQLKQLKAHVISCCKGIDEEKYKEIEKDDYWMLADEALKLGACDEILKELI